jgi:hypothetical protein
VRVLSHSLESKVQQVDIRKHLYLWMERNSDSSNCGDVGVEEDSDSEVSDNVIYRRVRQQGKQGYFAQPHDKDIMVLYIQVLAASGGLHRHRRVFAIPLLWLSFTSNPSNTSRSPPFDPWLANIQAIVHFGPRTTIRKRHQMHFSHCRFQRSHRIVRRSTLSQTKLLKSEFSPTNPPVSSKTTGIRSLTLGRRPEGNRITNTLSSWVTRF